MIIISLNDKPLTIKENTSLSHLLKDYQYETSWIATAINQQFIPHHQYEKTILQANDKIEIVTPMQGG